MNLFFESLHDMFKWVPDWRSGVYISILALLILFRQVRVTLVFLFASAYLWGGIFMFAPERQDVPKFFHAVYCAAGAVILIGMVVYFIRQRAHSE